MDRQQFDKLCHEIDKLIDSDKDNQTKGDCKMQPNPQVIHSQCVIDTLQAIQTRFPSEIRDGKEVKSIALTDLCKKAGYEAPNIKKAIQDLVSQGKIIFNHPSQRAPFEIFMGENQ